MLPNGWKRIGSGLNRPESVQIGPDGAFYVSHRGHGASKVTPNGDIEVLAGYTEVGGEPIVPNGIALLDDGSILIANISDAGGVYCLKDGEITPFVTQIGGSPMPPVNFVTTDENGQIWFSVSSTFAPRHLAYRRDVKNGFVGIIENGQARILLEGLHYTNEIRPDQRSGYLYVSETFSQRITRFPMARDLSFGKGECFAQLPRGAFVDGIFLEPSGGVLAACVVSNEIFHISQQGEISLIASERNGAWVDEVERSLDAGLMNRSHFDNAPSSVLRNVSSIAIHGEYNDRLICGSLLADYLVDLPLPVS